jgi:transcriptional regulator with XRE-family HTH domain
MFSLNDEESRSLAQLGQRLRRRRLEHGEPQARVAARLGVSLPTYRKLEKGDPTAQVGTWARALRLYGSLSDLEALFPESLFDEGITRQRAPRRTSS